MVWPRNFALHTPRATFTVQHSAFKYNAPTDKATMSFATLIRKRPQDMQLRLKSTS